MTSILRDVIIGIPVVANGKEFKEDYHFYLQKAVTILTEVFSKSQVA